MLVLPGAQGPLAIAFMHEVSQRWVATEVQSLSREHPEKHTDPSGAVHVHTNVAAHWFGWPGALQVSGAGQVPQSSVPPQPSEMDPQSAC